MSSSPPSAPSSVAFCNGVPPPSSPTTLAAPLCTSPSLVRSPLWNMSSPTPSASSNISFVMESGATEDTTTGSFSPVEEDKESAVKIFLKEKEGVTKTRTEHRKVIERILGSMHSEGNCAVEYRVHPLKNGNCNSVYGISKSSDTTSNPTVVVKVLSPLAQIRLEGCCHSLGAVDSIASDMGIGPVLLSIDPEGICSSFIQDAIDLTEEQLHSDAHLCRQIGQLLARLHGGVDELSFNGAEADTSLCLMLWSTLDRMIDFIASRKEGVPRGFTLTDLKREVLHVKTALEAFELPIVLAHGDCKAANILSTPSNGRAYLIDFELAGRSYRGYDVCKLFRSANDDSASHQRLFAHAYLAQQQQQRQSLSTQRQVTEKEVDLFLAEAALFEPVTWLEAAIFFVFSAVGTEDGASNGTEKKWQMKARDRWTHYLEAVKLLPQRIQHYQQLLENEG